MHEIKKILFLLLTTNKVMARKTGTGGYRIHLNAQISFRVNHLHGCATHHTKANSWMSMQFFFFFDITLTKNVKK